MSAQIQIRRDTGSNWTAANPTIADGEICYDSTAGAIKIGTGVAWSSTAYLASSLPYLTTAATSFNGITSTGRYRLSTPSTMTEGPAAPIDAKAADGQGLLTVTTFGSSILQQLSTEGDGTQPQKSWIRIYDSDSAAWRAWTPLSLWAVNATEGTDIAVIDADVKGVASFAPGAVGTPSIAANGDLDTGIYFPGADQMTLMTAGTDALAIGSSQGVTCKANVQIDGQLNMTAGRITNVADPTSAQDAVTTAYLESGARVGQTAVIAVDGASVAFQVAGTATSGLFTIASSGLTNLRSVSGTWSGIACTSAGDYGRISVTPSACTQTNVGGGIGASPATFHATLVRTA
jgi:hypothetical protein